MGNPTFHKGVRPNSSLSSTQKDILQRVQEARKHSEWNESIRRWYLVVFNAISCLGWVYCLGLSASFLSEHFRIAFRSGSWSSLLTLAPVIANRIWSILRIPLLASQTLAVLEIVHVMFGLTAGAFFTTLMQVSSRLYIVWGVLDIGGKAVTSSPLLPLLVLVWSIAETIRYPFYVLKSLDSSQSWYPLTWLRYSGFIVLYPLGVACENILAWTARAFIASKGYYSIAMPNMLNVVFHFPTFMLVVHASYFYGFPLLYKFMLASRRKVLGSSSPSQEKPHKD